LTTKKKILNCNKKKKMEKDNLLNEVLKKVTNIEEMLIQIKENNFSFDDNKRKESNYVDKEQVNNSDLEKRLNLPVEKINNLIHFENNDVVLLFNIPGKSNNEKQINATLLILTLTKLKFNKDEIASKELTKKLKTLGIGSLSILSNNLKQQRQYFVTSGAKGSINFSYKITIPGLNKGIELFKNL
jgi:hypothetical protein